jgi:hypothetical protein
MGVIYREITVHALGARTQSANFLKRSLTGQMDVIVQYLATNSDLPNNYQFQALCFSTLSNVLFLSENMMFQGLDSVSIFK